MSPHVCHVPGYRGSRYDHETGGELAQAAVAQQGFRLPIAQVPVVHGKLDGYHRAHEASQIKVVEVVPHHASKEEFECVLAIPLDLAGVIGVCECELVLGAMIVRCQPARHE